MYHGLNPKQKKFADEYIISGNAYQSAINAGYSEKYAKNAKVKMVEKGGNVSEYINRQIEELRKPDIAKVEEILSIFTMILRQELKEEVTELNQVTGEMVTYERKPSIDDVIKAGKELMKRYPNTKESEKLSLEIEKLKQQLSVNEGQEDKLIEYMKMIKSEVITDGD